MNSGDAPDKARRMVAWLEEKIASGELPGGGKIPTLRALMERFGISCGSAKRGVDHLVAAGLLDARQGQGTFVRQERALNGKRRLAALSPGVFTDTAPGIYATVFLGVQKAAVAWGYDLLLRNVQLEDLNAGLLEELARQADGVVLLGEYTLFEKDLALPTPGVGVCVHNSLGGALSIVDIDPFDCAAKAAAYFHKLEVDEVVVVSSPRAAYLNRARQFMLEWDGRAELALAPAPLPPGKAYLFTTCSLMQDYHQEAIGKPMLGIDGKNFLVPGFHRAPALAVDWEMAGRLAVEECLRRITHPGAAPRRIYLPAKLLEP